MNERGIVPTTANAKHELRSAKKHGHFAIAELSVSVEHFAQEGTDSVHLSLDESSLEYLTPFIVEAIQRGIMQVGMLWDKARLPDPIGAKISISRIVEQPTHSSGDDIAVAVAMASWVGLLDVAVLMNVIDVALADTMRALPEIVLDYGGRAKVILPQH